MLGLVVSMSLGYLVMYIPLLVAVALVVGGTRHEKTHLIMDQTIRTAVWITSFMLGIYVVLQIVSWLV
ncbi:MAG: hypothetical protein AAGG44_03280 [Planctomycetota bacterium]